MPDDRLELLEKLTWDAERARADRTARGSRAGTATVAAQNVQGVVLAETSIRYSRTYSVGEDGTVTESFGLGFGFGEFETTFALG